MITLSKNLIKKLYYKNNLSASDIAKKLNTTVWVVLGFMRRNKMLRRSFQEANKNCFENKPLSFSLKKRLSTKDEKLKMVGIFLY